MTYAEICTSVRRLKKKNGETDPVRLCGSMGIRLLYQQLGKDETAIKGYFIVCKRIPAIVINDDLPETIQKIIIAHELGHACLHRKQGISAFHEVTLFDESSTMEKEANLFAAELLLDDGEVVETLNRDLTFFGAASALRVPMELLDFKFRIMKWRGDRLIEPPIDARSDFLKNMEVPGNADYND